MSVWSWPVYLCATDGRLGQSLLWRNFGVVMKIEARCLPTLFCSALRQPNSSACDRSCHRWTPAQRAELAGRTILRVNLPLSR
jgi:hypothetical protein